MADSVDPITSPTPQEPYPAATVAWFSTILFAVLYWLSILDRFILSLLVDPIRRDLGLSDLQLGLLHGFAFAVTFSLFGLLAGLLADRVSRRWIIFASVSVWSIATAACGMAQNFWQLMLARIGVGAGEAGLNPCATSMISDLFPRHRITAAMAVYAMGASVGSGCAYLLGGIIVTWVSRESTFVLPLVGEVRSWQAVFYIVGTPGLLFALLVFAIPDPVRRGQRKLVKHATFWRNAVSGYVELFRFMRSRGTYFLFHYAGFGVASIVLTGAGVWYPAHMARTFGWDASQIGLTLGLLLVSAGIVGKLICGFIVDAMFRRGIRDAQLRWFAVSLLAAIPFGVIATTSDNPWIFLGGLLLFLLLMSPLPVCSNAALNLITPNELRGAGIAFFSATAGLIGMSVGPILIAGVSDYVFGGNAIGYGIAAAIVISCPLAAFLLFSGLRGMRNAVAMAEDWT